MFKKPYLLIILGRTSFSMIKTTPGKAPSKTTNYRYTSADLQQLFTDLRKGTKSSEVRIILKNEACYTIEYSVEKTNEEILTDAKKRIPEDFAEQDARISILPKSEKKMITVPVMTVWKQVIEAVCEAGFSIGLFCAEKEAEEFGATAQEGISEMKPQPLMKACKPESKQEKITDKKDSSPKMKDEEIQTPKQRNSGILYPLILILIILISLASYMVFAQSTDKTTTQITPTITPTTAFTPTPTIPVVALEEIKLQVLNATGQAGVAGEVASLLSREGFNTIDTGNAPLSERGVNTIAIREASKAAALIPKIQDILDSYEFDNIGTPLEDDNYDLQVIIGK